MKAVKNTLTIRLDDELLEQLKELAKKEYRPLALQIRKMLDEAVKKGIPASALDS